MNMVNKKIAMGIKLRMNENLPPCTICLKGKLSTQPFSERAKRSGELLEIVRHMWAYENLDEEDTL